jgi:hypothetical protein
MCPARKHIAVVALNVTQDCPVQISRRRNREAPIPVQHLDARPGLVIKLLGAFDLKVNERLPLFGCHTIGEVRLAEAELMKLIQW